MTPNLRAILLGVAERHMRFCFEEPGQPMSRERATALLPQLPLLVGLDDDFRAELLSRFEMAEPLMVAGRDYLPALPPVVEHYEMSFDRGGVGEPSGVTCCCGSEFDGFLNLTLARQALDYHIEARKAVTV